MAWLLIIASLLGVIICNDQADQVQDRSSAWLEILAILRTLGLLVFLASIVLLLGGALGWQW